MLCNKCNKKIYRIYNKNYLKFVYEYIFLNLFSIFCYIIIYLCMTSLSDLPIIFYFT